MLNLKIGNLAKRGQAISQLRDDQNMNRSLWVYVSECQNILIFIDNVWWNLFRYDLVKSKNKSIDLQESFLNPSPT